MFKWSNTFQYSKDVRGFSEKELIWIRLYNLRGNEGSGCVAKIDFKITNILIVTCSLCVFGIFTGPCKSTS